MRNRKIQRELRRSVGQEQHLDRFNLYGVKDPTPEEAVRQMILRERMHRELAEAKRVPCRV